MVSADRLAATMLAGMLCEVLRSELDGGMSRVARKVAAVAAPLGGVVAATASLAAPVENRPVFVLVPADCVPPPGLL